MLSFTTLFLLALGLFSVFSQSASAISHQGTRRRHHARLAANQRSATSPSLSVLAPTATSTAITSANPVVTTNVLTTRSTLSAGRTHLGCYSDNILRVIVGSYSYASWLNADACLDVCASQGFSIGGVEYGRQCFCGNKLDLSGLLGTGLLAHKKVDSSKCSVYSCKDGSDCGGFWAIDVYSISSSSATSTSSSLPSSTSSSSSVVPTSSSAVALTSSSALVSSSSSAIASSTAVVSSTRSSSAATASSTVAWTNQGCVSDSSARSLTGYSEENLLGWSVADCVSTCQSKGFAMAGIEVATQCYCGNSLASTAQELSASSCNWYCYYSPDICGGPWALSIFSNQALSSLLGASPSSSSSSSLASSSTSVSAAPTTSSSASSAPASSSSSSSVVPASSTTVSSAAPATTTVPSSSGSKAVYVHMMVGNTYPYTQANWLNDIQLASAAGFDGFALNIGSDSWQWTQVSYAYAAAAASGTGFKLFLSFDMTVLPCTSLANADLLKSYITTYGSHPSQATYGSAIMASTFAGSDCTFGVSSSWDVAWQTAFKTPLATAGSAVWFVPSVFSDPSTFGNVGVMDGELNWNSGWPMSGSDLDFSSDATYISNLGSKQYMAAVSPAFYTHYGVSSWNKNWIYRSDDWLYASRWETLIANRDKIDLVEALTWNDYGESSYIGPIDGAQPNSQAWVDGFDHTPLLAINAYYAAAFKTGVYPTITTDRVYLTARTHPALAVATSDSVPRPTHADWTDDNFYALVFATSSCTVTLSSSAGSSQTVVAAGVTRLKYPLASGGGMSVQMTRNSETVVDFTPSGFEFVASPATYNFNYQYYASS